MCCLPASEAFIILTSFLQSCVDGCHSSATLLAHFCFLWRPFPTIMQIMIVAVPHLEHAIPPDAMLSTRPPRARTDALRSKVAIWFPVRGSLFFCRHEHFEVIPAKTGSECTVCDQFSCFMERSCPLLYSSLS